MLHKIWLWVREHFLIDRLKHKVCLYFFIAYCELFNTEIDDFGRNGLHCHLELLKEKYHKCAIKDKDIYSQWYVLKQSENRGILQ